MANIVVVFIVCIFGLGTLQVIHSETIILSENDLIGTCTKTCSEMPTFYDKNNCKKISGCRRSSAGYNEGFVRCDYCACECERETGKTKDILVEKKKMMANEKDLYNTCTGTCYKKGLVRTNFQKCQKVEDCKLNRRGYTFWFVRCDYCTCSCINIREAASYKLENVHYDMSELAKKLGKPTAVAHTILENHSGIPQTVTRTLTFEESSSTSVTTSHSLETGLTVTVTGRGGVKGLGEIETSVETSLAYGFTTEVGKEKTTTKTDSVEAAIKVPAHSSITATVVGHRVKIDIPFSADLVTTYKDGAKRRKHTTGMYHNVQTGQFRVQYSASKKIRR